VLNPLPLSPQCLQLGEPELPRSAQLQKLPLLWLRIKKRKDEGKPTDEASEPLEVSEGESELAEARAYKRIHYWSAALLRALCPRPRRGDPVTRSSTFDPLGSSHQFSDRSSTQPIFFYSGFCFVTPEPEAKVQKEMNALSFNCSSLIRF
jgi:hypothetical protein